jgi:hypothetical protein
MTQNKYPHSLTVVIFLGKTPTLAEQIQAEIRRNWDQIGEWVGEGHDRLKECYDMQYDFKSRGAVWNAKKSAMDILNRTPQLKYEFNEHPAAKRLGVPDKMPYEGFKPDYTGTILPKGKRLGVPDKMPYEGFKPDYTGTILPKGKRFKDYCKKK